MEYWPQFSGLMGNPGIDPPIYAEHTTLALNANRGYRRGYYGEYLYDVPPTVTLYVLNNNAMPAPDVTVRFFQRASYPNMLGSKHGVIDNVPEITVTTGASGTGVLPNRDVDDPVSTRTGHTLEDNPFGVIDVVGKNYEFLVEITTDDHQEYQWLDITTFNLLAWRGEDVLTLATNVPPPTAPAPAGSRHRNTGLRSGRALLGALTFPHRHRLSRLPHQRPHLRLAPRSHRDHSPQRHAAL